MAGKRKRRKKGRSLRVFWTTFLITILAGCTVMLAVGAVKAIDHPAFAASARGFLQKVIAGESKERTAGDEKQLVDTAGAGGGSGTDIQSRGEEGALEKDIQAKEPAAGTMEPPETAVTGAAQPETAEVPGKEEMAAGTAAAQEMTDGAQQAYADGSFLAEDKVYAKETANAEEVSLVFAGDILFDDNYAIMARLKQRGGAIEQSISADMLQVMRDADIFMVNNEFPYSNRGEPTPDKTFTFRGRPEYAGYLLDMGADIVSLANNHASDYGTISLTDTIDVLNSIGMPFVGAGRNLEEAAKTAYFTANGMKIAILSATQIERMENPATKGATETSPGVFRCLNIDRLLTEIQKAKQNSDFVIVYIHWGTESTDQIDWAQREQAPKIAEAGADLIIGDHPHVLQPIGYCGNVPVVYSLGNYLFNSKAQDTCLVRAVLNENGLKSLQFIPGRQQDCSVTMHYGAEKERVLNYMRSISPGVSIDADGYILKQ